MTQHEYTSKKLHEDKFDDAIQRVNESIVQLEDQNDRFGQVKLIGNKALRHVVRRGISDEQIDSFYELMTAATEIPYEEIGNEHLRLSHEFEVAQSHASEIDESLMADLNLAKRLTDRHQDEMDATYQTEQDRIRRQSLNLLREQYEEVTELFEAVAAPWPIPQALSPDERTVLHDLAVENAMNETLKIVDIIPVSPEEHERNAQIAERAKHIIESPDLSKLVMFYLKDRHSETVTVEDLIRYCYTLDADDTNHYRSRITTTLGPKVAGLKKQEELHAEGYTLQYGWRYAYEIMPDGRRVTRRRTRIYRVIDTCMGASEEPRGEYGGLAVFDEWLPTEELISKETVYFENVDTAEIEVVSPSEAETNKAATEQEYTWQEKLALDVEAAIDDMQEAFLFLKDEEKFKGGRIRSTTASARIGTKTSYELLVSAGLMRRNEIKWDVMDRRQILIAYVINSHPVVAGGRGKRQQKDALAIIDAAIERRLAELDK